MKYFLNKFLSLFLILVFTLFLLEIASTVLINLTKRFEIEKFSIWGFTELVENNRVTLKKETDFNYKEQFFIYTDKNRLRSNGVVSDSKINNIENEEPKILFIGDSVPFGWGVSNQDSIPGIYQKMNNKLISINGAIPSFSLSQSIERFEIEFSEIKNIKYIYLQIYDPVHQYYGFGKKWDEKMNFNNQSMILYQQNLFLFKYDEIPFYGELNFLKILQKIYIRYFFQLSDIDNRETTEESDKRFVDHINRQLEKLYDQLNQDTILIIAPVTTPDLVNNIYNKRVRIINLLNEQLKKFNKENVIYFNLVNKLKNYKDEELFIDNCCHLSVNGNLRAAEELSKILSE